MKHVKNQTKSLDFIDNFFSEIILNIYILKQKQNLIRLKMDEDTASEKTDDKIKDEIQEWVKLPDISDHPGMQCLKQLYVEAKISKDLYSRLTFKLEKLNSSFVLSCKCEQVLHRKAHDLNRELKEQKLSITNSVSIQAEHRTQINLMRQAVTNLDSELDNVMEQIQTTMKNTGIKTKELEKLQDKLENAKENNELESSKMILLREIKDIEESVKNLRLQKENLISHNVEQQQRYEELKQNMLKVEGLKKAANQQMVEIASNPGKIRQMIANTDLTYRAILSEEKQTNEDIINLDEKYRKLLSQVEETQKELKSVDNSLESVLKEITDNKYKQADLKHRIQQQKEAKTNLAIELNYVDKLIQEEEFEQSKIRDKIESLEKNIRYINEEGNRFLEEIAKIKKDIVTLNRQLKKAKEEQDQEMEYKKKHEKELDIVNENIEKIVLQILANERDNKELAKQIQELMSEVDKRRLTLDQLREKEREMNVEVNSASLIRDRKAREYALMKKKTLDIKNHAHEKHLNFLDLARKAEEIYKRSEDFSLLYETVKIDRNKHVSAIQSASQLIVELKDKIRTINAEGDVLAREYNSISHSVELQKNQINEHYKIRDSLKEALEKAELEYQKYEDQIDIQMSETIRMNKILENLENQIISSQKRYMIHSEDCMDRRRLLIDKQDALCLLHEQFNRNAEILRQGEQALKERDEEIRIITTKLKDFERTIEIYNRKIPECKKLDEKIDNLKEQIKREEKDCEELVVKLEIPDENGRKRNYCGKDFSEKELNQKIASYEERISNKKKEIWEAQILYRELKEKNDKLDETKAPDSKSQKSIKKSGKLRAHAMDLNRKKKAAISELAVMQATQMDLMERTEQVKEEIADSSRRAKNGEAFDDYSAKVIRMHERDINSARRHKKSQFDEEEDEDRPPGRQKFEAYPTSDGLSRPYGGFPVFQPQKKAPNLRHYKRELEREVKI